jgi:hypothetical protein
MIFFKWQSKGSRNSVLFYERMKLPYRVHINLKERQSDFMKIEQHDKMSTEILRFLTEWRPLMNCAEKKTASTRRIAGFIAYTAILFSYGLLSVASVKWE